MRFLVVGLVLIGLGTAVTEYSRRHPEPSAAKPAGAAKKPPARPEPPPQSKAMLETQPAGPLPTAAETEAANAKLKATLAAWVPAAPSKDSLPVVLAGSFAVRELRAGSGFAVVALENDGQRALVRLAPGAEPVVLAVRLAPLTALAVDEARVVFAEGGDVFSVPAAGGEVTALVSLAKARVSSLAVRGELVLAALTPKDADPFAADPNGVVAKVTAGAVTAVATDQVRPTELLTETTEAFWIAGYPSGLVRAAVDGAFTARIVDRATGPIAFDDDGLVFRAPVGSGSELKHTAKGGGAVHTLARLDFEFLAAGHGQVLFTTSGVSPHLYSVASGGEPQDLLALKGTVRGLSAAGATVVVASTDEAGLTSVRLK